MSHRIGPPHPSRQPLKVNLFEHLRNANTALSPLFPYLDLGAIVPAGTLFENKGNPHFGFFQHRNDVDEVIVCFASEGSRIPAGFVRVGPREHFVGNPFKDDAPEESYAVLAIVQRQSAPSQDEIVIFRCVKCHSELLAHSFVQRVPNQGDQVEALGHHAPFETLVESLVAYDAFNDSDRTCGKCGLVNPPFPTPLWGIDKYVTRSTRIQQARKSHEARANGGA